MNARLATLPLTPRRLLAVSLAAVSVLVPLMLIWVSVGGLADNWARRAALAGEVGALRESLAGRAAAMPAGAAISASVEAADAALVRRADALDAALEAAGAEAARRGPLRAHELGGVVERRLTVTLVGAPEALAAALAHASGTPGFAVSDAVFDAPASGAVRLELTLVELVADEAGS